MKQSQESSDSRLKRFKRSGHAEEETKQKLRISAIKSEQRFYFYLQIKKRNSPKHVEVFILFVIKNALNTINRNLEAHPEQLINGDLWVAGLLEVFFPPDFGLICSFYFATTHILSVCFLKPNY